MTFVEISAKSVYQVFCLVIDDSVIKICLVNDDSVIKRSVPPIRKTSGWLGRAISWLFEPFVIMRMVDTWRFCSELGWIERGLSTPIVQRAGSQAVSSQGASPIGTTRLPR